MDIYNYLNSMDVAEHCRKIGHEFNAIEAAFIIEKCYRLSIKEKHDAFRELMDTMPDMKLPDKLSDTLDDLDLVHCLKEKIRYENEMLDIIYNGKENMVYSYCTKDLMDGMVIDGSGVFTSYQKAKEAAIKEIEERETENIVIIIEAKELDNDNVGGFYMNRKHEISRIFAKWKNKDVTTFFNDIWIYIPTPFKKGDLLYMPEESQSFFTMGQNLPMVLTKIDYWDIDEEKLKYRKEKCDSSDMIAYGFWPDAKNHVYDECCHAYQDLEYYRGELIEIDMHGRVIKDYRLLKAISAYMHGEINEDMFLAANNLIRAEYILKSSFPGWDYCEEWYEKAGISDIWDKRKIIEEYEKGKR